MVFKGKTTVQAFLFVISVHELIILMITLKQESIYVKRTLGYPKTVISPQQPGSKTGASEIRSGKRKDIWCKVPFINKLAAQFKSGGFELIEELWRAGSLEEK
ncbi:MAG: hypothetical protein ACXWWC_02300 [Chitinophagaceae bacterium]